MPTVLIAILFFCFCFALCASGLILTGKPLKKGCSSAPGNDGECICESTGDPNACSSIQEEDLVAAIRKAQEE